MLTRATLFLLLLLPSQVLQAYSNQAWLSIFPPLFQQEARARIDAERAHLLRHKGYLEARLQTVQPLIRHIAHEVRRRQLPGILILLPFIESGYRLEVVSSAGAAGIWQLMPATARRYGVPINTQFDGRYSLPLATDAALTYLRWLNQTFQGDWLLTLAAYNAGEGRIQRAQQMSGELSYWRLPLAEETRRYVPRLLALAEIIHSPERFGITLPDWYAGEELVLQRYQPPLSLAALAEAGQWPKERLAALNPALRQGTLTQGEAYLLLVPAKRAQAMAKGAGKLGLAMGGVAPLITLDSLDDPLILSGSQGLDLAPRSQAAEANNRDPLGMGTKRPLLEFIP
ncbi:MAG: transglycosylase SLT domain-containing protein [Aeromonadaceae bacterium]